MKILVIGGSGMAGHMLLRYLAARTSYQVYYTLRPTGIGRQAEQYSGLAGAGLYLDARDSGAVDRLVAAVRPDIIVNATGILNDAARLHEVEAYRINGLLPHQLAGLGDRHGARLIHISTDCVFTGDRGHYEERHVPDGTSVYAKTKALGEVSDAPHLTIRTSIIGPEIRTAGIGLLGWFLQQQGPLKGFMKVPWNGVTTLELAKFIHHAIERGPQLSGLVHLTAPEVVSKYELLQLFAKTFGRTQIQIHPDDAIVLDRTLKSTRADLDWSVPAYAAMLEELREWMEA